MLVRANIFSANSSNYVGPKICWSPKFVSDPRSPCKQCWRQHIHQKSRKHVGPKEIFLGVTPMLAHVGPGQLFLDFRLSKLAVEKVGSSPRTYPFFRQIFRSQCRKNPYKQTTTVTCYGLPVYLVEFFNWKLSNQISDAKN